jgi:hypothetical protein
VTTEDVATLAAMERYGGGFVKALARAANCADEENLRRLKVAFPEYWVQYREVVFLVARRAAERCAQVGGEEPTR